MRAINLLPDQGSQSLSRFSAPSIAIGGASLLAIVAIFMGVSFMQAHSKVSSRQDTLAALTMKTAKLQTTVAKSAASQGSDQARVAAFSAAASARIPWDDLLDDVSRVLPSGSWLSSLNMAVGSAAVPAPTTSGTPVPTSVPTSFTVSGFAFSQNEVARVMQRLALVPALAGVTLQNSTRADVGETKAFQFTINATVLAPEVDR